MQRGRYWVNSQGTGSVEGGPAIFNLSGSKMNFRSWASVSAGVLAVLPWIVAIAGAVLFGAPVVHGGPLLHGSFVLAFWIAVACFAACATICAEASKKLPWVVSAIASFCYILVFTAMQAARWFAVSHNLLAQTDLTI